MYQIISYYQENNQKISEYKLKSRYLWEDHISYTRNAIISILSGLPDIDDVTIRLLQNQEDLGTLISPYYSSTTVDAFVNLLKQHIVIAADVIKGIVSAEEKWRDNGNEIVNFMHEMNRVFWPTSITKPLWNNHLDLTITQVNARKNSVWGDDIQAYDENHVCISQFSDLFSNGIIYQNIDQFCLTTTGAIYG